MFLKRLSRQVLFYQKSFINKQIIRKCSNHISDDDTAKPLRNKKSKSFSSSVQHFVDECQIKVRAGSGGDGCINFLHDWSSELGGPNGGDGGHGGHILFHCTSLVKGLNHCKHYVQAKNGNKGLGKDKTGKNAEHCVIDVPIGTVIKNDKGRILADMHLEGMLFVAARGGSGGRGNKFFASPTEQTPQIAEYGAEGETRAYILEVKSMAHVGLLGFPNAGKSTLLRAITRARPQVESYAFTTLNPHIGMVLYDDYEQIAVADLPGLIPDSHKNKGLGIQFLKHVERCCCLLYLLDTSQPEPWNQFNILQYELSQFQPELLDRPMLVVANKMDLEQAKQNLPLLKQQLNHVDIISLSAKVGTNLTYLLKAIRKIYDESLYNKVTSQSAQ